MSRTRPYQLLQILCDGQFHSGQKLAEGLGVSRTSIASYIKQFSEKGLDIYCVKGKGYRLSKPLFLFDREAVAAGYPHQVHLLDEVDSTNAWLMARLDQLEHGALVCCEYQSAGRGRRGRNWLTPIAGQLAFSLYWQHHGGMEAVMGLSLVVGIVIAKQLRQAGYADVGVKWPNDLYIQGKKLGGILVEMSGQADGAINLVVGIGLNVSLDTALAEQIEQPSADLAQFGKPVRRSELLIDCAQALDRAFTQFSEVGLTPFIALWDDYDVFAEQGVQLTFANQKRVEGINKGIDTQGNLMLEVDGQLHSFLAGEVSLRAESSSI